MEICTICGVLTSFLILLGSGGGTSSDKHSLQYLTARTPGKHFTTVALLDRMQFAYFGNTVMILKMDCMKNAEADDQEYWRTETERVWDDQDWLQDKEKSFNQTKEVPILNREYGCEFDSNDTTTGYDEYACDGEDFISLNLRTGTWTAANDKAKMFIKKWGSERAQHWKDFLEKNCIDQLKKFVSYSKGTLDQKVRPEVSVFQKHFPSLEVVCHATGFFPKAVMITWQNDGEDVHEDVELRETLPNQDGSFQKRSILTVPAEELQKHTYTCVVQHSSLEKELVREVPKGEGSERESDGAALAINIPVVMVPLVVIATFIGIVALWRRCSRNKHPHNEAGIEGLKVI